MQRLRSFVIIGAIAGTLAVVPASRALADEANQETYLTFSAPVEIPGVVLPPGTYTFRLVNPDEGDAGGLVQVFSRDGSKLYSTFPSIPVEQSAAGSKPVVVLEKAEPNGLEAIRSWFYPGDPIGHKFVYPKPEAQMIAAVNHAHARRAD